MYRDEVRGKHVPLSRLFVLDEVYGPVGSVGDQLDDLVVVLGGRSAARTRRRRRATSCPLHRQQIHFKTKYWYLRLIRFSGSYGSIGFPVITVITVYRNAGFHVHAGFW